MDCIWKYIGLFSLLLLFGLSTACGTTPEPFEYRSDRDLKPGPGLFSGEDGVFQIVTPVRGQSSSSKESRSGGEEPATPGSSETRESEVE